MNPAELTFEKRVRALSIPESLQNKIKGKAVTAVQMRMTPRDNKFWDKISRKLMRFGTECPADGMSLYDFMLLLKCSKWKPTVNDVLQVARRSGFVIIQGPCPPHERPDLTIIRRVPEFQSPFPN